LVLLFGRDFLVGYTSTILTKYQTKSNCFENFTIPLELLEGGGGGGGMNCCP